jgi:hypothetical protein
VGTCLFRGYLVTGLHATVLTPSFTRPIRKITSSELLSKQAMREKILHTKNTYILKPLLNVVTVGIEALVVSGNAVLYACVKQVCRLRAEPSFHTFHQLLINVDAL